MLRLAIYGKGGIGKSTLCVNLSRAFTDMGLKVLQIGCDPKADSTLALHPGTSITPLLSRLRENPSLPLEDAFFSVHANLLCLETGGPIPGQGCAGRGIGMVLEYLNRMNAYTALGVDCVLYDVLGDVVCGGFSMPMRKGYAEHVLILTSEEKMSLYACANIAMAVQNGKSRGYADLGGIVVNARNGENGDCEALQSLIRDFDTEILGNIPFSPEMKQAEREGKILLDAYPTSSCAKAIRSLAECLCERF